MDTKIEHFFDFEDTFEGWLNMGERYERLKEDIVMRLTDLDAILTEEQKRKLGTIRLLYHQKEFEAKKAAYKAGFKTGMGLAIEAVADEYKGEPVK